MSHPNEGTPVIPIWLAVPGYENSYEVSSQGQVRSRPRPTTRGGILKAKVGRVGYPRVSLCANGVQRTWLVHQVVAVAFLGPRPAGQEVRHLDGDPLNNAVSNLAYGTRSENAQDKQRHGTDHNARKTHCPQGHPYDEENTSRYSGRRACRACVRAYHRRLARSKRDAQSTAAKQAAS
ncbi:NUMOD4 motif-containing HNH endonuclease [Streptomyces flavochromogenes]|uniref:NUMOD4 motif-containing HNH endonuclease n=1 Tax=Streptomyces flavochromogenes TaxID=68199 RepID=UPI00131C7435